MDAIINFYSTHQIIIMDTLKNLLLAVMVLVLSIVISKLIRKAVFASIMKISNSDEIVSRLFSKVTSYAIYLIAIVIILDLFGVNTTSLVALVGATGLAIGLALKDTLSNIAAGIMLLILKPIKKGEFVEFSGLSGSVKDIGLFTTILETGDGLFISSPNRIVWGATIKNYSRNSRRRMDITVGISYDDSIEVGLNVLKELALSHEAVLQDPAPKVLVQMLADSSVNLQLRAWCPIDTYWDTYWSIQRQIKPKIEEAGLSIPYPQRDLHLTVTNKDGMPSL
ncbi:MULTISPECIES: mechanosensitive ion channel family protein [Vibrio]|uniref:Small-conductance mechanosensitive channel n=2 Tax=Vibrio TaxID=662 RepID=A0A7X4LMV8_9VIBR|nr:MULTISPECIES: mechanosensitive ion channel family protein [Vibrio]MBF8999708.1 mechanosensitive ion channel family protein [Vibrio nitrifigilis]MZI94905.1 mechanosensitive ion channel [Vibrio eleionomae]